jgi:hypothetical protein
MPRPVSTNGTLRCVELLCCAGISIFMIMLLLLLLPEHLPPPPPPPPPRGMGPTPRRGRGPSSPLWRGGEGRIRGRKRAGGSSGWWSGRGGRFLCAFRPAGTQLAQRVVGLLGFQGFRFGVLVFRVSLGFRVQDLEFGVHTCLGLSCFRTCFLFILVLGFILLFEFT